MRSTPQIVASADGTPIAYESTGDGPPVILIGGAFNDRTTVAALAAVLAPRGHRHRVRPARPGACGPALGGPSQAFVSSAAWAGSSYPH
jgi:pimeloyl-ACP methyl ester carboxylesterase